MMLQHIALVSTTNKTSPADLALTASALQKQATRDLGPIWEITATVDYFPTIESVPAGYWQVIISDSIDDPNAAGYHTDKNNQPYALVAYDDTWQYTCSHEVLEMLVDPYGNRMMAGDSIDPNNPGRVNYLVEVCDPCEDASFGYSVNGILVSDFYTPHYFDPVASSGVQYSFTGALQKPREVKVNGYLSWIEPISGKWYQATHWGTSVEINAQTAMLQNSNEPLRAQMDRLTVNPNKMAAYKTKSEAHKAIQEKTMEASNALAKSRIAELIQKGYIKNWDQLIKPIF